MKLSSVIKTIAPYITAILMGIGVYAENHTQMAMMQYRVEQVEKDKDGLSEDIKSIKSLLYSIDTRLSVYGAIVEERTGK